MLKLLGLSGSLRAASTNTALLRALSAEAAPDSLLRCYDGLGRLPIFNPDDEGDRMPPEVRLLIEAATHADGLIISCPEYAHGIPGGLKNALDWLVSGPVAVGKPVMLVHASGRSLASREALREVLHTMSFAISPLPELEVPLLGKPISELPAILGDPAIRMLMRESLSRFAEFIREH